MEVYADYAATTPVKPEVVDAMMKTYQSHFDNPSSVHSIGRDACRYLDQSRHTVTQLLGANPSEVIFTSDTTGSDSAAIKGLMKANKQLDNRIITTKVEHHSVLHVYERLEREDHDITYLDVDDTGAVDLDQLRKTINDRIILVSIMFVNNETGTIQDIYNIKDIIGDTHALFHADIVQVIGRLDLDFHNFRIGTMDISAHKFDGLKGVDLLLVKEHTPVTYNQLGGEQETKCRAGTRNLPQVIGLTKALKLAITNQDINSVRLMNLKELFLVQLQERAIPFGLSGSMTDSTGHTLNIYFPFTDIETMLTLPSLTHVYVSSDSACTASSTTPSHVLAAMFEDGERAKHSIRFSFNGQTTAQEIKYIVAEIHKIYHEFKGKS